MKEDDAVNPLLNGCLTGQLHALFMFYHRLILKKNLMDIPYQTLLIKELLGGAISTMASLGTFEILRERVRNSNGGRPPTLYQDACCGLISGTTAVTFWQPFELACSRVGLQNLTYTNWFASLAHIVKNEGVSTLWRGKATFMATNIAMYTGILASYHRSLNYFIETEGLSKSSAHICGSMVSGFFAAACVHPVQYTGAIVEALQKKKLCYENIPRCIGILVTPYSGYNFYANFVKTFRYATGFCMVQYGIYEGVRGLKWTNK